MRSSPYLCFASLHSVVPAARGVNPPNTSCQEARLPLRSMLRKGSCSYLPCTASRWLDRQLSSAMTPVATPIASHLKEKGVELPVQPSSVRFVPTVKHCLARIPVACPCFEALLVLGET